MIVYLGGFGGQAVMGSCRIHLGFLRKLLRWKNYSLKMAALSSTAVLMKTNAKCFMGCFFVKGFVWLDLGIFWCEWRWQPTVI